MAAAEKELAYLKEFGRPLLPFQRVRRETYQYQKQLPSDHVENLNRYLLIASSLIPGNPALSRFSIRHPDLRESNIIVSRSSDSDLRIVSLFDWQHASILPLFLLAGIPECFQNYGDHVSDYMLRPSLPGNWNDLDEVAQGNEKERYRRRLVHYHYYKNTQQCNPLHYAALADPISALCRRLFCHAGNAWEGETLALKVALIDAAGNWEALTGEDVPCPVVFDAEDVRRTMDMDKSLSKADEIVKRYQNVLGFGSDGWVPTDYYEEAMASAKQLKESTLAVAESDKDRADITEHWPWDDMDEQDYM